MDWPTVAVERVRPSRFLPPFCPWPACRGHRDEPARFHRHGCYARPSDGRPIPRYKCLLCHRTCSRQSFSFTYYLKRRDLPVEVAAALVACSAHRQIARSRKCSKTTVTRLSQRLGRHCVLLQSRALRHLERTIPAAVHDHFETFVTRQDQALGIGTAVAADSWFLLDVDPAPHRGSGRRPDREGSPPRPGKGSYVESIRRTLDVLVGHAPVQAPMRLVVDGRDDYPAALRDHPDGARFALAVHPNPKRGPKGSPRTAEAIARDAAMFPVDQLHQLLRHTCSDHKRETIAFGRRRESIVGRIFLTAVWRNFVKHRSERKPDRRTAAMLLELADGRWSWERVLTQRLFPTRETVPPSWSKVYWRTWTPGLPVHAARHAY